MADEIGLDSFIFGFKLATQLAHELKKYDGHLRSEQNADEDVRHSIMSEEENDYEKETLAAQLFHWFCTNSYREFKETGSRCSAMTPGFLSVFQNSSQTVVNGLTLL